MLSELGPCALGRRSILADPRSAAARTALNERVKRRESFRPFAPAVLAEAAADWFELGGTTAESPFMLRSWPFKPALRHRVTAVVHHDGTGRVEAAQKIAERPALSAIDGLHAAPGIPLLLNTSFNGRGEPLVETPEDALWRLLQTGLDFAVIEDRLIEKTPDVCSLLDLVPALAAESYTVETPLLGQRFASEVPAGADLLFRVKSPWGAREVPMAGALYPVLTAIDGLADGWAMLDRLAAAASRPIEPSWLVDILGQLRRAAILTLRRAAPRSAHQRTHQEDTP